MRTVKVKICGITSIKDLEVVCSLGADAVGFVVGVPSSPRNLSLEKAEELFRSVPIFVKSVLVLTPQSLETVLNLYERLKPDIIQIHGEFTLETATLREKLSDAILVKGVNVKSEEAVQEAVKAAKFFDAILLDSWIAGKHGGTGLTHNWMVSKRIKEAIHPKPLILAGGLNAENVKEAVLTVKPYAVDVSTGVEAKPGVKDYAKVEAFIKNAKQVCLADT
ncbi:MAG: phosphoribosylanthranilate isomerase [Candidatus Bathyarchaeota archaeon]